VRQYLTGHEPIEKDAKRCQVLLHGGRRVGPAQFFNVRRRRDRLDQFERELAAFAPATKPRHAPKVRRACIPIANRGCEEFEEPAAGLRAGSGD